MPHRHILVRMVNDRFFREISEDQRKAVSGANDLASVLAALDLLKGLPGGTVEEIEKLLGDSAVSAMVGAVRSAVRRGLPVSLQWIPHAHGMVEVFEAVANDKVGVVGINVRMPWLTPVT